MIQHKPGRQILTKESEEKKNRKENWGNIYRGALPLPDDLLEHKRRTVRGGENI